MSESRPLLDRLGVIIYDTRLGLIPMYAGLWIGILAYNFQFFREIFEFLEHWRTNTSEQYLLWILGLVDITMIGNLLVMTTIGGYSTFVKEYSIGSLEGKPRWMNGLDSSTLKIKMSMSLVGVSAIHLLRTFMEAPTTDWNTVGKQCLIHALFIVTTLAFTWNARLSPHKAQPEPETKHEPH